MHYLIQRWIGLSVQSLSVVLAASVLTQFAVAQGIEEVTIQAEIQEDTALDDLVSVSSLSAEKLADAGIEDVEDVAAYVPNLVLTQTETGTSIVIRGIGAGANQGFDQSVGLYIDGVPLPRANMARAPFLDLSSVQVLRGPQYVLDGNYSIAGSVHMLSNLSIDEFQSGIDINYVPSQNAQSLLLTAGGPLSDVFAARVAIQAKRSDGYIENVTRNEGNESDDLIGRFVLGFFPTDNLSFKLKVEKGSFKTTGRAIEIILDEPVFNLSTQALINGNLLTREATQGATNKIAGAFLTEQDFILSALKINYHLIDSFGPVEPPTIGGDQRFLFSGKSYLQRLAEIYTNPALNIFDATAVAPVAAPIPVGLLDDELNFKRGADAAEYSNNDSENFTLNIEYWLGEHQIKSASSFISYEYEENVDADFTAAPLIELKQSEEYEQLFQRFDYISPEGYFLEVKAGVSYLYSDLEYRDRTEIVLSEKPSKLDELVPGLHIADLSFDPNEPIRQYLGAAGVRFAILALETYAPDRIFTQTSDTTAAYLQGTLNWSDTFRTRLGLRYTHSIKEAERDLAIIGANGEIPHLETGDRQITTTTIKSMFSTYLGVLGVQHHSDRYSQADLPADPLTGLPIEISGAGSEKGRKREEQLLPSITLEWDIADDFSTFFSARMANKLGGFDARSNTAVDALPGTGAPAGTFYFDDEMATTYELGTKWYLPYSLGEMTAVLFYTDYKDLQISRFDGKSGFNVDNAEGANSKGIEIEGLMQFTDQFSMNYSLAWIDFTFDEFLFGSCHLGERPDHFIFTLKALESQDFLDHTGASYSPGDVIKIRYEEVNNQPGSTKPWLAAQQQGIVFDPINNFDNTSLGAPAFCDFKGKTNQFVAEWQGTFSFNYETEIKEIGLFKPTLDVLYNSGYFTSASQDPLAKQEEYIQLNGRLALVSFEDTWTVALTGQNLTNQKIVSYANDTPLGSRFQGARGFIGFIRPPRTIGLNFRYNFY